MRVVPSKCSPFTIGPASYLFVSAYGWNQRKNEYIGLSPPEKVIQDYLHFSKCMQETQS